MNPRVPSRLGRLLGEYERLTRNEGAALRAQDFSALAEAHALKSALLVQIMSEGAALGLDRRVLWFDGCLAALAAMERENVTYAARVLGQLSAQRENLSSSRKRLRGLGHAYRSRGTSSPRLFALG